MEDFSKLDKRLIEIVPSKRQFEYQKLEFTGFLHFTVNTFTDKEWGDGTEDEAVFNPTSLDADQWVRSCKAAGMKGVILTCKHHDGFCLWPSKYTDHTVAKSPYKNGKGDIVREVSDACKKEGLKFGIYLSPWDRNSKLYGQGTAYDDYYINQLTELLTSYGDIFTVWLDGACGEGPNGKKQFYDWPRIFKTVRALMPDACINICGPDIRWCGNEAGDCRKSEWSVVPKRTSMTEYIASLSQQADDDSFRQRKITAGDENLGGRDVLFDEPELIWYPAEVNTSIRPGWFYHESEDSQVRDVQELFNIYLNSVGGNASLLLNVPPNREGLISEKDREVLKDLGDKITLSFQNNLLNKGSISGSKSKENFFLDNIRKDDYDSFFEPDIPEKPVEICIEWEEEQVLKYVVIKENILNSQRVEAFSISVFADNEWKIVYEGTVIGYKRIVSLDNIINTKLLKIEIYDYRVTPQISFIGVY